MQDRTVLITGASRGLGRALARAFGAAGARLLLTARGEAPLAQVADQLAAEGVEVLALPGDVTSVQHRQRLVEAAETRFGGVDVLINNASFLGPSPQTELAAYPLDTLRQVYEINLLAPLALIQRILPRMRQQGVGVIINVTSDAAAGGYRGWGGYGSSKAALELVTRTLREEVGPEGIRVYAVDPGDMNTRMHQEAEPGVDLSHLPDPEVAVPVFLWLATGEARSTEGDTVEAWRFQAQKWSGEEAVGPVAGGWESC